ncbi:HNH endonuclease, partial [Rhodococcoides yunnanense]|uniref:HNH endonuclease n=1 Tax=Rhodococcoides yunnanense TaxID=278209 RepID=UPI0022B15106
AHELAHQAACDARARHETERRRREEGQRHKASDKNSRPDSKPGDQPPVPPGSPPLPPPVPPPGPPPVPVAENTALNTLGIYPLANGRSKIDGNLDTLTTEKLKTALSPLTAPTPSADGTRDPRTPNKRNADGLAELLDRYLSGQHKTGPSSAHVKLIVPLAELMKKPPHGRPDENQSGDGPGGGGDGGRGGDGGGRGGGRGGDGNGGGRGGDGEGGGGNGGGGGDRAGDGGGRGDRAGDNGGGGGSGGRGDRAAGERTAGDRAGDPPTPDDPRWPFHLEWTGPISRHLAELLTCDADLTPVIVDEHGVPLALGRTIRLATPAQREAVTIRDHCCVMCGRPAQWCEVHHVTYWQNGGATDLNNLALLCTECHRQIHNTDWQLAMGEDGHPQVIPPATIDPEQQPIPSYHRRRKRTA